MSGELRQNFMHTGTAKVLENTRLSDGYALLRLRAPDIAASSKPGQFVMLRPTSQLDPLLPRPFSLFDAGSDWIAVYYLAVGRGTRMMLDLNEADNARLTGPLGNGFDLTDSADLRMLVAGGCGIAPLHYLVKTLRMREDSSRMVICYGGKTAGDLAALELLKQLDCEVSCATENGSKGKKGLVTDLVEPLLDANFSGEVRIAACGPEGMLAAVAGIADKYEVPCELSLETHMACGIGACNGCVVRVKDEKDRESFVYRRTCVDGPVFDARTLLFS